MSSVALKPYGQFTDEQWSSAMTVSYPRASGYTVSKYMAYKITLYFSYVMSKLNAALQKALNLVGINYASRWSWWTVIEEAKQGEAKLYLGALPIIQKSFGATWRNDAHILKGIGVQAVLSLVEPFENHERGGWLNAVTTAMWKRESIMHLQIPTPDFSTIEIDKIHCGVEFIHWNLQRGRSVYVHCKAGQGRSALVTLCYLIKYRSMSCESAMQTIQRQRNQVSLDLHKIRTAKRYEELIRDPSSCSTPLVPNGS